MLKTAESVSPKHPDKMCDRISDAILDELLSLDFEARGAIEVCGGHGHVHITGEYRGNIDEVMMERLVKGQVKKIAGDVTITQVLSKQSPEIAQGVDTGGAGDQGIMVGYACNENDAMMPTEHWLARDLNQYLFALWPEDGKTQVTFDFEKKEINTLVASWANVKHDDLLAQMHLWAVSHNLNVKRFFANPAGDWSQSGFEADAGVTGRKLIVDNYGPRVPIGGGAFSGKDGTKVDRSGAYLARRYAVDLLRLHDAKEVFVYLAYAIGYKYPVHVSAIIDGKQIDDVTEKDLELMTPKAIIDRFDLTSPQFEQTAEWGAFGHGFKWDV